MHRGCILQTSYEYYVPISTGKNTQSEICIYLKYAVHLEYIGKCILEI